MVHIIAENCVAVENYAYVANDDNSISIYDISIPTSPKFLHRLQCKVIEGMEVNTEDEHIELSSTAKRILNLEL